MSSPLRGTSPGASGTPRICVGTPVARSAAPGAGHDVGAPDPDGNEAIDPAQRAVAASWVATASATAVPSKNPGLVRV